MKLRLRNKIKDSGNVSINISNSFNSNDINSNNKRHISPESRAHPNKSESKKAFFSTKTFLLLVSVCLVLTLVLICLVVDASGFTEFFRFANKLLEAIT